MTIFNDRVKELGAFLQGVLNVQDVVARAAVAAVPEADGEPGTPAISAVEVVVGIPIDLKVQIKKEIQDWISGEQVIYALLTKSLIHNKLKCKPVGVGRKQLRDLENYWKT